MASIMPQNVGNASRILVARQNIAARDMLQAMNPRQKPIADWLADVIERRKISARAWAERAGLGKDTVSRALRDDYASVMSTRTLAMLAEAVDEHPPGAAAAIPSVESLQSALTVILEAFAPFPPDSDVVRALASSLRETLLQIADEPNAISDPAMSRMAARAAVRHIERKHS